MSKSYSLNKSERLKSVKITKDLFSEGYSVFQYPLKCIYLRVNQAVDSSGPSLLFATTASKRSFKQAVKRNRIKRHIREAYRLNKLNLYDSLKPEHGQWALMYIYIAKNMEDLSLVPRSMAKVNKKLLKEIIG